MLKSQNNEAEIALNYFGDRKINILDVGANDGKTYSNSYDLLHKPGNQNVGFLFEPGSVFEDLKRLYRDNPNVFLYNKGLGATVSTVTFYESGAHVKGGRDKGLVSSISYEETVKWRKAGVEFTMRGIHIIDFKGWWEHNEKPELHLISLDTEGSEWEILSIINLEETKTEMLIIEFNGNPDLELLYTERCSRFGLTEISRNAENLIFALP